MIVYEKKEGISLYKRWVGIMRDLQLKDLSYKKSYSMNLNIKVGEYFRDVQSYLSDLEVLLSDYSVILNGE